MQQVLGQILQYHTVWVKRIGSKECREMTAFGISNPPSCPQREAGWSQGALFDMWSVYAFPGGHCPSLWLYLPTGQA